MQDERTILVTNALPYANGVPHLGHMVGAIQGDIWVRFKKMTGYTCYFICGSDGHGTPIMIQAEKLGVTPEKLIKEIEQKQAADFKDFLVDFDNFYTTHSEENKRLVEELFKRHTAAGNIIKRIIQQLYDPKKEMFLPDRYVKGECPNCGAKDQYGDNCEVCGATYSPIELKNAYSTLSGAKPVEKSSEHYFFKLNNFESFLKEWTQLGALQEQVSKKLDEWFKAGLKEWDISRDSPYFGFKIPGEENKYFYVWLDAPVGYMASFENFCHKHPNIEFNDFWGKEAKYPLYHFIGKDIIYFHALFWPAILQGASFRTPSKIYVNGFLTIEGQKMSKSRGTFILARTYLKHLNPEYMRYYFAAKLSSRIEDLDINFADFTYRINADLVGKFVNIASRCASFLNKHFDSMLSKELPDTKFDSAHGIREAGGLVKEFQESAETIANHYENIDYSHAVRLIMALADKANQYIDEKKPWSLIKDEKNRQEVAEVCSLGINLFRMLMIYLKPILPETAKQVEKFLNIPPLQWSDKETLLLNHQINLFQPLMQRIEPAQIEAIKQETKAMLENNNPPITTAKTELPETNNKISIEDFNKVDLRVAQILEASAIDGADKLISLKVDLGDETRHIIAGIKSKYEPEVLIGKYVVVVANLAPRKMRFGISEGMVLAAGGDGELWLISPESGAKPGMRVK